MKKPTQVISASSLMSGFLFMAVLFLPIPAKAEMGEIKNPAWREVPGTKLADQGEFDEPAYINVNGIEKNGNILTYDLINPDSGYARVQTNCQTRFFRAVRLGSFESATRVNYTTIADDWEQASSPYHRALIKFVCNL